MCGIAAIFSPKGNLNKNDFARMDASLPLQAHRGPDSHGVFSNDFISLGVSIRENASLLCLIFH